MKTSTQETIICLLFLIAGNQGGIMALPFYVLACLYGVFAIVSMWQEVLNR